MSSMVYKINGLRLLQNIKKAVSLQRFWRKVLQSEYEKFGRLAQLVQSICLTSRGSGVRIPQRPHKIKIKH
jgi:hypothetical protein